MPSRSRPTSQRGEEQVVGRLQVVQQLAHLIIGQLKGRGLLVQPLVRLPDLDLRGCDGRAGVTP